MNSGLTRGLRRLSVISAVAAAFVLLLPSLGVSAQPLPPNRFFGRVTANGQPAAGATINALVGTVTCGSSTTDGSGSYRLDVLSSGERPGCGTDGATVIFNVGSQRASQTATWRQGEFTSLDLNASPAPSTATPTATATTVAPTSTPSVVVPTSTATVARTATPLAPLPTTVVAPQTGTGGGENSIASLMLAVTGLIVLGGASLIAVRRARS